MSFAYNTSLIVKLLPTDSAAGLGWCRDHQLLGILQRHLLTGWSIYIPGAYERFSSLLICIWSSSQRHHVIIWSASPLIGVDEVEEVMTKDAPGDKVL